MDYKTGKAILKLLQDTCRTTGKTVVLITHNSAFADIADRVIHVREGRVASCYINPHPATPLIGVVDMGAFRKEVLRSIRIRGEGSWPLS